MTKTLLDLTTVAGPIKTERATTSQDGRSRYSVSVPIFLMLGSARKGDHHATCARRHDLAVCTRRSHGPSVGSGARQEVRGLLDGSRSDRWRRPAAQSCPAGGRHILPRRARFVSAAV